MIDEKVTCLALRAVSFSDSGVMLSVWTSGLGLVSAAAHFGAGRESRRRRALMSPPMMFEAVATRKGTDNGVVRFSDVRTAPDVAGLSLSPVRTVVATFLAEVLSLVLRDTPADLPLSDFIFSQWRRLASLSGRPLANFHIAFLVRLTHFLGIEPDVSMYRRGYWFDMRDAVFCQAKPNHNSALAPARARVAALLLRLDVDSVLRLPFNRDARNEALDSILEYISLHHTPLTSLKSLDILRQLFG